MKRVMAKVAALPVLFLVTSCFLKQEPPKGPTEGVKLSYYQGFVSFEEASGAKVGADIVAAFRKATAPIAQSREVLGQNPIERLQLFQPAFLPSVREPSCSLASGPTASFEREGYADIGRIGFGPAEQSSLVEIPKDEQNRYILPLETNVPTGHYIVASEGTTDFARFQSLMSIPEPLLEVDIRGSAVEPDEVVTLSRSKNAEFRWKAPVFPNDLNQILIRIDAKSDGVIHRLECQAMEKEISQGRGGIAIGSAILQKLPETDQVVISVARGHLRGIQGPRYLIYFEGMRTFLARGELTP